MAYHIYSSANTLPDRSNEMMNDEGNGKPSYSGTVGNNRDPEKMTVSNNDGDNGKDDPFGDETNSEVKYKTLHWW